MYVKLHRWDFVPREYSSIVYSSWKQSIVDYRLLVCATTISQYRRGVAHTTACNYSGSSVGASLLGANKREAVRCLYSWDAYFAKPTLREVYCQCVCVCVRACVRAHGIDNLYHEQ